MRYDPVVIWEPFVLALVLGLVVSAGLYYAYLWPSVEPLDPDEAEAVRATPDEPGPVSGPPDEPEPPRSEPATT